MELESQLIINPYHKPHPIKLDQLLIVWIKFIIPSSFKLGMSYFRINSNILNQSIKCFFDLFGSCFRINSKSHMQYILECLLILITRPVNLTIFDYELLFHVLYNVGFCLFRIVFGGKEEKRKYHVHRTLFLGLSGPNSDLLKLLTP